MDKRTGLKMASIALFVHGFIEILGALALLFAPGDFLPTGFAEKNVFWVVMSAVYGVSRLIAGYTTWIMKKWGVTFGIALSITTMIVAPSIYPFGIMDLILAVITLASMLFALFGDEKL